MVQDIQSTDHFDGANVTVSVYPASLVLTKHGLIFAERVQPFPALSVLDSSVYLAFPAAGS